MDEETKAEFDRFLEERRTRAEWQAFVKQARHDYPNAIIVTPGEAEGYANRGRMIHEQLGKEMWAREVASRMKDGE